MNSKEIEKKSFSCSAQLDCDSRPLTLPEKHLSGNTVIENTYKNADTTTAARCHKGYEVFRT